MSGHQTATVGDTVYFWFAANDTSGSGGDGTTPLYDVREAGAAAGAIPLLSGTPTLLSHANYPAGCYEVAVAATVGNGFAADDTFAVFCTLAIDSQNPSGFVGSCTLTPLAKASALATAQTDLDTITGSDGVTLATAQGNYAPATASALTTAQNDLDTITGSDGATLATAQGLYAPAKAGDAMSLAAGAVTNASLAGNMEIVFETDFATNYNSTRNAWATNLTDTIGTLVGGEIAVGAFAANSITAAALAADAGTEIGTAVWATATRVLTANTNLNDPTAAAIADAVWDEAVADHTGPTTFGGTDAAILADTGELQTNQGNWLTVTGHATEAKQDIIDSNVDAILLDTGTTLDNHLTDIKGTGFIKDTHSLVDIEAYVDLIDDGTSGLAKIATDAAAILDDTGTNGVALLAATQASIDAIETDTSTTLDNHLTDIKGTGFVKDTHSLIDIETYVDLIDDGTSGLAKIATDVADVLVDTSTTLDGRIPAALVGGKMASDAEAISGSTTAADKLEALMDGVLLVQVNDASATTTAFAADGFTEADDDHFNGRLITFVTGALTGQQTDITDYDAAGGAQGSQQFTVTALTEAPANNVWFVIH